MGGGGGSGNLLERKNSKDRLNVVKPQARLWF